MDTRTELEHKGRGVPLISSLATAAFVLTLTATPCAGTIIDVRRDGSGDFTAVGDAVLASAPGDTVRIGSGHYHEPRMWVRHALTIFSTEGPESTVVDGGGSNGLLRFDSTTAEVFVEGIRFTRGHGENGSGSGITLAASRGRIVNCVFDNCGDASVAVLTGAVAAVDDCLFRDNASPAAASAILVDGSSATITRCRFEDNTNGPVAVTGSSHATLEDCAFVGNRGGSLGGTVRCEGSTLDVSGCLFWRNLGKASALMYSGGGGVVEGNTFHGNSGTGSDVDACIYIVTNAVWFERNLVTYQRPGVGLRLAGGQNVHMCNLYSQNSDGAIGGAELGLLEGEAWPMYCDVESGDFRVSSGGPAAPGGSVCGELIGAFPPVDCAPATPFSPVIISILDVPNDEGRQVRVKWKRSPEDTLPLGPITRYSIYRYEGMVTPAVVSDLKDARRTGGATAISEGWDYLKSVPARGDTVYLSAVPTTCDSTPRAGLCQNAFFVAAETDNPTVFWDSRPDTGYSIDNLAPDPPGNLVVTRSVDDRKELAWSASRAPDIDVYHVYRGVTANFEPSPLCLIAVTKETRWSDPLPGKHVYKVTAVDIAGNESDPATSEPVGGSALAYSLGQNAPNPFTPRTVISYTVRDGGGRVTLRVYDAGGRLVRTLVDRTETPGTKFVSWKGRNDRSWPLPSGVYFYRLTAAGYSQTRKMVLVR